MSTQEQLAAFYRQLGTMLEAGVPVVRALESLERSAPCRRLRDASAALRQRIAAGGDLSDGLEERAAMFPALHRELIRVGERSGTLERQLHHLAAMLDQFAAVRKEVVGRMFYPVLLLHLSVLVMPLPRLVFTQDLIAYGRDVLLALVFLYAAASLSWWIVRQIARDRAGLVATDRLVLALPVVGKIHRDIALARFFAALKAMLNAGIGLIEALPRAGAASGSARLASTTRESAPGLQRGEPLALLLAGALPPDALSMVATGQESGKLDDMLDHLERRFFDESRRRLQAMADWLPKLIYIAVVLWVGWQILQMGLGYARLLSGALDE
ncbi:MAG: type II secretion system F family protein [Verrucomicrobia bacterium]|nr:type II secretion system F family protein [Verrucomicrobiota bacterium]